MGTGRKWHQDSLRGGGELGITTDSQLRELGQSLPNFQVHAMTDWSGKIPNTIYAICNTDTPDGGGKHWVAYRNIPKSKYVQYIDPFGATIDPRLLKYLKSSGKPVMATTTQIQDIHSDNCGYWSLMVLYELHKGKNLGEILAKVDALDQKGNEMMLRSYFAKKPSLKEQVDDNFEIHQQMVEDEKLRQKVKLEAKR